MKRNRWVSLLLTAVMFLSGCASASLPGAEETAEGTAKSAEKPPFAAQITLSGEGRADSTVRAKVETEARGKVDIRWYLDGKELQTRGETLQIPYSAADKELVCRATCEGCEGFAESEPMTVEARGENASVTCAGLWEDVKWINRTEPVGTGMTADWSCSGFEMNLWSAGGEFRVYYQADQTCYFVVVVDGVQVDRPLFKGAGSYAVELTQGEHTLRLCKETEVAVSGGGVVLESVVFDGEVLERPADKEYLIHVVGASTACGDGALGVYTPGRKWSVEDHSATHAFGYVLARWLDADYDIVAKGGSGFIKPSGAYNAGGIYDYINRYRGADRFDFKSARTPDIILLNHGGNDASVSTAEEYYEAMTAFIRTLLDRWGDTPVIVWVGGRRDQYEAALRAKAALKDVRFFTVLTHVEGKGSAALETQTSGHPDVSEQEEIARQILDVLRENGVVNERKG